MHHPPRRGKIRGSEAVYGIDAYLVAVELDVGSACMQDCDVVGLPDNAVKESRERIKRALRNCGCEFPCRPDVTINLAPADVRKEVRDLTCRWPCGWSDATDNFSESSSIGACSFGELSLDGTARPVRGALSAALAARKIGLQSVAVLEANAKEAAVVQGVTYLR
jgi:magnesium chelatase family protein